MPSDTDNGGKQWPWFLLLAVGFGAIPWAVYGATWPVALGFFSGAVATKWFVFAVFDWKTRQMDTETDGGDGK